MQYEDAVVLVSKLVADGRGVSEVLWALKRAAVPAHTATRAIRAGFSLTLGEAANELYLHKAWQEEARKNASLQDAAVKALDELTNEKGSGSVWNKRDRHN
ncbi:hypothetical protein [Maricaulis sp.]|uniref:hypothetical protein n=1 Tax=Maricaulis sp. TaxID=1486257 RepID=UPI002B266BE5|nr:hypothetical protein [Maricaulis sp.]